jgi:hypothetical protein
MVNEATFADRAAEREREIDGLLDLPWYARGRPWDSEARKSLARIKASLQAASDIRDRSGGKLDGEQRFLRLLEPELTGRSLDNLIELVYALDEALVRTGDKEFLERRAAAERLPDGDEATLPAVETQLRDGHAATQQALLTLYEARRFRYRRQRARRRMRTAVLLLAGVLVLALVVALTIVVGRAVEGDRSLVLLAAIAGALGGTLANVFRLRDEIRRGTELRAFKPMLLAQPAVGAASGLVLLLAVEGGFLGLADQSDDVRWASITLLAFAAGISEALFLGIVRKAAAAVGAGASADEHGPPPRDRAG